MHIPTHTLLHTGFQYGCDLPHEHFRTNRKLGKFLSVFSNANHYLCTPTVLSTHPGDWLGFL